MEDLSSNLKEHLHFAVEKFELFVQALNEITNISDSAQLCIFGRGVDA